eukprot:TRINITY_DN75152_c0_g1_i1.p1 TRINITY_DN75152_c0_g1~~TRINITY_DN75152_c0_g1_i1.p1  ORF type:complete len:358 (-),score=67.06 TRINITY_DN75152_c0_g1_i1:55-1128(-)
MGLLLGRTLYADQELPQELRAPSVGAGSTSVVGEQQLVFFCPRCHRRLCPLWSINSSTGVWRLPFSRLEKVWLGGGTVVRCHACGSGRVSVEELGAVGDKDVSVGGSVDGEDWEPPLTKQRCVSLRMPPSQVFRPFSVCVCGIYESVVSRAAAMILSNEVAATRQIHVVTRTLKRSELASNLDGALPALPLEVIIVAHRISGQRNPITDAHGLYSSFIEFAWPRADVVLVCLFDLPTDGYFLRMLEEQPTLFGLLRSGRLLPIFADAEDDSQPEAVGPPKSFGGELGAQLRANNSETDLQSQWLLRCLDGRVPKVETPIELVKAGTRDSSAPSLDGTTEFVLKTVVSGFGLRPLVRD